MHLMPTAKNVKVHTTSSQSVVLHYPKKDAHEDDDWLDIGIPETFVTVIKDDKVVSTPMDSME